MCRQFPRAKMDNKGYSIMHPPCGAAPAFESEAQAFSHLADPKKSSDIYIYASVCSKKLLRYLKRAGKLKRRLQKIKQKERAEVEEKSDKQNKKAIGSLRESATCHHLNIEQLNTSHACDPTLVLCKHTS